MKISQIIDAIKLKISHGFNINFSNSLFMITLYLAFFFSELNLQKFVLILMQESHLNLNKLIS